MLASFPDPTRSGSPDDLFVRPRVVLRRRVGAVGEGIAFHCSLRDCGLVSARDGTDCTGCSLPSPVVCREVVGELITSLRTNGGAIGDSGRGLLDGFKSSLDGLPADLLGVRMMVSLLGRPGIQSPYTSAGRLRRHPCPPQLTPVRHNHRPRKARSTSRGVVVSSKSQSAMRHEVAYQRLAV